MEVLSGVNGSSWTHCRRSPMQKTLTDTHLESEIRIRVPTPSCVHNSTVVVSIQTDKAKPAQDGDPIPL